MLTAACHQYGIRFFIDSVMAFSKQHAYQAAATNDFFILNPAADPSDPDAQQSSGEGIRDGFGSDLKERKIRAKKIIRNVCPMTKYVSLN